MRTKLEYGKDPGPDRYKVMKGMKTFKGGKKPAFGFKNTAPRTAMEPFKYGKTPDLPKGAKGDKEWTGKPPRVTTYHDHKTTPSPRGADMGKGKEGPQ